MFKTDTKKLSVYMYKRNTTIPTEAPSSSGQYGGVESRVFTKVADVGKIGGGS